MKKFFVTFFFSVSICSASITHCLTGDWSTWVSNSPSGVIQEYLNLSEDSRQQVLLAIKQLINEENIERYQYMALSSACQLARDYLSSFNNEHTAEQKEILKEFYKVITGLQIAHDDRTTQFYLAIFQNLKLDELPVNNFNDRQGKYDYGYITAGNYCEAEAA